MKWKFQNIFKLIALQRLFLFQKCSYENSLLFEKKNSIIIERLCFSSKCPGFSTSNEQYGFLQASLKNVSLISFQIKKDKKKLQSVIALHRNAFWTFLLLKVKVKSLSHVQLFGTPWTVARQAQSPELLCSWDFPGKNTGVGCHFLLQEIFPTQGSDSGIPHSRQTLYHLSHQGNLN